MFKRISPDTAAGLRHGLRRLLTVFIAVGATAAVAAVDDPPNDASKAETAWQKMFRRMAADYRIAPATDADKAFALNPKPVMRWSQPVRGGDDGVIYAWLDQGRPAVIGQMFIWPNTDGTQGVSHELHSLATTPLTATWRGREQWTPKEPGIVFQPCPDAPQPAAGKPQRLLQMKRLAAQFAAESVDDNDRHWQLRLLPQPLFRYDIPSPDDVLDGALIAFVEGTDPEVILLLEARRLGGAYQWQYALARMSDLALHVRLNDREIWQAPHAKVDERSSVYFLSTVEFHTAPPEE